MLPKGEAGKMSACSSSKSKQLIGLVLAIYTLLVILKLHLKKLTRNFFFLLSPDKRNMWDGSRDSLGGFIN